jgi:hypothetical protein
MSYAAKARFPPNAWASAAVPKSRPSPDLEAREAALCGPSDIVRRMAEASMDAAFGKCLPTIIRRPTDG